MKSITLITQQTNFVSTLQTPVLNLPKIFQSHVTRPLSSPVQQEVVQFILYVISLPRTTFNKSSILCQGPLNNQICHLSSFCSFKSRLKHFLISDVSQPLIITFSSPRILIILVVQYDALKLLYISLVPSHLCQCSQVWAPQTSLLMMKVKKVQRRASRFICKNNKLSYKDRLISLNLLPIILP